MIKRLFLLNFLVVALALTFAGSAHSANLKLVWDPSPSTSVVGYKVYYGTSSGDYTHIIDVGNSTQYQLTNLQENRTYYVSATAYDAARTESDFSEELSAFVPDSDADDDGIPDQDEIDIYGTDPYQYDSDGDGIGDGDELAFWGTDWNQDFDHDGFINLLDDDSDNDGTTDGQEIADGTDPGVPGGINSHKTVYEDAEDGAVSGWDIYDASPLGAVIDNVYDVDRQSRVIEFTGSGTSNGYALRLENGRNWTNTSQFVIQWSMSYQESYYIYIDVMTTAGHRYLSYAAEDYDSLGSGEYIYHGLGSDSTDGQWRTFTRDLSADLAEAQPGVTITEVNGFLICGSGRVDDIQLLDAMPMQVDPVPDIKANGGDDLLTLTQGDPLTISVSLLPESYIGVDADSWLLVLYFNPSTGSFTPLLVQNFDQGPLGEMPSVDLFSTTDLPVGVFIFGFGVDLNMNGAFDADQLFLDLVPVFNTP